MLLARNAAPHEWKERAAASCHSLPGGARDPKSLDLALRNLHTADTALPDEIEVALEKPGAGAPGLLLQRRRHAVFFHEKHVRLKDTLRRLGDNHDHLLSRYEVCS
jgi:hypothetical protein